MDSEVSRLRELARKARRLAALTVVSADAREIALYAEDCERRAREIEDGEPPPVDPRGNNPPDNKL